MTKLHFAVLAHAHEPLVADLIDSLRTFYPGASMSIFNGGHNPDFMAGRGVTINPHSSRIRYGNMTPFHFGTFRWLESSGVEYDHLITLDHDVMAVKPGLDEHLAATVGPMGYAGARLREAPDPAQWELGGSTIELIHLHWSKTWAPLLGLETPWWAFNPGQVFGHELVSSMTAHRHFSRVERLAVNSRIWAIEEIVLPSLAISAGAVAHPLAGGDALHWSNVPVASLPAMAADPDVFFVHRVPMSSAAPERQAIKAVQSGGEIPAELLAAAPTPEPVEVLTPVWTPRRWRHAGNRRVTQWLATHRG